MLRKSLWKLQTVGAWARGMHGWEGIKFSLWKLLLHEPKKKVKPYRLKDWCLFNIQVAHCPPPLGPAGALHCPDKSQVSRNCFQDLSGDLVVFNMQVQSSAFTLKSQCCLSETNHNHNYTLSGDNLDPHAVCACDLYLELWEQMDLNVWWKKLNNT